uniref:Transmembrane protein n=1 Tax=Plectus sambesii TaxID=2011161 RepID=A0A914W6R6_9BILA
MNRPRPAPTAVLIAALPHMKDSFGEADLNKVQCFAGVCGCFVTSVNVVALIFYTLRLVYFYETTAVSGDVYFGLLGAITSLLALQAMAVAFAVLLLLGIAQKQRSYMVLWVVSALVLISIETVIVSYSITLQQATMNWDPWHPLELCFFGAKIIASGVGIGGVFFLHRAVDSDLERSDDERRFLL